MSRILLALLVALVGCLLEGWAFMVAVGIAHAEWIASLPTLGYWWAVLLVLLLTVVFTPKDVSS